VWVKLLKRVFEIDRQHCPNCSSELKIIAAIVERPVIEMILKHRRCRLGHRRAQPHMAGPCEASLDTNTSANGLCILRV
jgi:hypothetical protein